LTLFGQDERSLVLQQQQEKSAFTRQFLSTFSFFIMLRVLTFVALWMAATAFAPQPFGMRTMTTTTTSTARFMFSTDDNTKSTTKSASTNTPPPLSTTTTKEFAPDLNTPNMGVTPEAPTIKNVVRNMNTGELQEVKWVDPAMRANTNPWEMNWWAYILFGFPPILLLNDVFHFLPTEGPLGFLGRI
jgi:cytoskeletal protein RodZ